MSHKFNAAHRNKIPKQKYRVTNWSEYNEGLRQRGDLTVWISEDALALWSAARRKTRVGQPHHSDLAIELTFAARCMNSHTADFAAVRCNREISAFVSAAFDTKVKNPVKTQRLCHRRKRHGVIAAAALQWRTRSCYTGLMETSREENDHDVLCRIRRITQRSFDLCYR
tara:strand:- start:636 stop:1142 length:507 start_codon:yes stop_codon:yes gene_type:complete